MPYTYPPVNLLHVLDSVVAQVRTSDCLSDALDAYAADADPRPDNVRGRWLPRRRGFEVTLCFDADTLTPGKDDQWTSHRSPVSLAP